LGRSGRGEKRLEKEKKGKERGGKKAKGVEGTKQKERSEFCRLYSV